MSVLARNGQSYKTKRLRKMYRKWRRRAVHVINTAVRNVVELLWSLGVSKIVVGYPKDIAQENGSFLVTNVWSYKKVIERLKEVAEEYGIEVEEISEEYTSSIDPFTSEVAKERRIYRGLFKSAIGKVLNADLVGAFSILKKAKNDAKPVLDALARPTFVFKLSVLNPKTILPSPASCGIGITGPKPGLGSLMNSPKIRTSAL